MYGPVHAGQSFCISKYAFSWWLQRKQNNDRKNSVKNSHFWSGGVELLYVLYVRVSFPQRVHSEGSALQISAEEHNEKSSSPPFLPHFGGAIFVLFSRKLFISLDKVLPKVKKKS